MECHSCRYPNSRVIRTVHDNMTNDIYRRRECVKCGARYTTQEHLREATKKSDFKTASPKKILDK